MQENNNTKPATTMQDKIQIRIGSAKSYLRDYRDDLILKLEEGQEAVYLCSLMEKIAKREGEIQALTKVARCLDNGMNIHSAIAEIALESPDDTYSGRCNDIRRAINDGRREVLRSLSISAS